MNNLVDNTSFEFKDAEPIMSAAAGEVFDAKIKYGEYNGDGNASQVINLGGKPKAVIVMGKGYITYDKNYQDGEYLLGGICFDGGVLKSPENETLAEVVDDGVKVYNTQDTTHVKYTLNKNTYSYRYIAFM